jgi:predicted nucleic acid-binding protein
MNKTVPPAFLDTSYIVRYLTNDPPSMAETAALIIDSDQPLIMSELILAESAYVLASVYKIPRVELVDALMSLIQRNNIQLSNLPKSSVLEALRLCKNSHRYSFADILLWAQVRQSESPCLYTFDQRFPNQGITLLPENGINS